MPRMRILSQSTLEKLEQPPKLDHQERKLAFDLPQPLIDQALALKQPMAQIAFVVQCAYFKISKRFFTPSSWQDRDIAASANLLGLKSSDFDASIYAKATRSRHQKIISDFYGFGAFDRSTAKALQTEIATMARHHLKPHLMFGRCLDFLTQRKTRLPKPGVVIELIRKGLGQHKANLIAAMERNLGEEAKILLDDLFSTNDRGSRYQLTLLKRISQSPRPREIKDCADDFKTVSDLFDLIEPALKALELGPTGIQYFAGSVARSKMFQINQRSQPDRYIHVVSFIGHQVFRLGDTLVDQMLGAMTAAANTARRAQKDLLFEQRKEQEARVQAAFDGYEANSQTLRTNIRAVADDLSLTAEQKVAQIRDLVDLPDLVDASELRREASELDTDSQWFDLLERQSRKLQNRIGPILKVLAFDAGSKATALTTAIEHFKFGKPFTASTVDVDFLTSDERHAVTLPDGAMRVSLYKALLFQHIVAAVKAGNLNVPRSYKYRPMDSYLIDTDRWQRENDTLIARAGLEQFRDPQTVLSLLKSSLHERYQATNDRAVSNQHLRFRANGQFVVETPAAVEGDAEPAKSLFPQRHDVPLAQILEVINASTGMLTSFEHWQQTSVTGTASRPALLAGIMGLGCGIGVQKMARISSKVTESELEHTVNWRFSLENVRTANDMVVQFIDNLSLPNLYRQDGPRHTASDGQKFEVRGDALHASRSFKYFGQGQGVSAYTFVDETNALWHSLIISAADRESAYVIDGLMHNDVVESEIHSTDTHGYTEAIFGLTYLLGFGFAPRIKSLAKQSLYIFHGHDPEVRANWAISHDKYVNEALISENWDEVLRLVTTIKLKESTASDIFRRLNSYSRQHALYQATKAFGQIIKSLFILRYIDDVVLRQSIERQLNKIELANRFTRAVAVGSPREFMSADKDTQEIAETCNRLIKNSIMCWNMLYLQRKLDQKTDPEAKAMLKAQIAAHSPMSWAHINLLGEYDFSDEKLRDSVGILPPNWTPETDLVNGGIEMAN